MVKALTALDVPKVSSRTLRISRCNKHNVLASGHAAGWFESA